jgi:hypothetical protein
MDEEFSITDEALITVVLEYKLGAVDICFSM